MERDILFNAVVTLGFLTQIYNYWLLGQKRVNVYTWLFVLGCFCFTEAVIAFERPFYWMFVGLNLFGIWRLVRGAR